MARLKGYLFLLHYFQFIYDVKSHMPHIMPTNIPIIDKKHYNWWTTPGRYVDGTDFTVPPLYYAPDYRVPAKPLMAQWSTVKEVHRPYRLSPHYPQVKKHTASTWEHLHMLGCYCCTVFKRRVPLAGCAVITTRHILTTATSTELILGNRKHFKTLENILGAWYDIHDEDLNNSSMYTTPARIHYHPMYMRPQEVNMSHPMPVVNDLAVWAATIRHHKAAQLCSRSGSTERWYGSPQLYFNQMTMIVGFQWIKAWNRNPTPFHKYFMRTRFGVLNPCPKNGWGWYHCIRLPYLRFGVESGAALHTTYNDWTPYADGLLGLAAFSMKLRTKHIVHYFNVIDTHPNLNFLYHAYMGRSPYEWLDERFYDTQFRAPLVKPWYNIPLYYPLGVQKQLWRDTPFW